MVKRNIFLACWVLATCFFCVFAYQGNHTFDASSTKYVLLALLICTVSLLMWLPGPIGEIPFDHKITHRGLYAILAIIVIGLLFLSRTMFGPDLLYAWPIISVGTLIYLRPNLRQKEFAYAAILALVAGLSGLGAKWVPYRPIVWSVLQVLLFLRN